jgi:hypothetical protein
MKQHYRIEDAEVRSRRVAGVSGRRGIELWIVSSQVPVYRLEKL